MLTDAKVIETEQFETGETCTFEPWTNGWAVGFKVTTRKGNLPDVVEFVYLNPSGGGDSPDAFVYCGEHGDRIISARLMQGQGCRNHARFSGDAFRVQTGARTGGGFRSNPA